MTKSAGAALELHVADPGPDSMPVLILFIILPHHDQVSQDVLLKA